MTLSPAEFCGFFNQAIAGIIVYLTIISDSYSLYFSFGSLFLENVEPRFRSGAIHTFVYCILETNNHLLYTKFTSWKLLFV